MTNIDMQTLVFLVFKILLLFAGFLYLIFSGLILRQIQLMSNTLKTPFTPVLWIFGIIHFILTGLLIAYFFTL